MVTPFTRDGALDLDAAGALATHLVDDGDHDGLVISGTTGEALTLSDAEKADLLRVVVGAVGDRAAVVAGVGTFSTEHTAPARRRGSQSWRRRPAGGHPVLLCRRKRVCSITSSVADSTDVPIMLYDTRSGGHGNCHRDDDPAC